MISDFKKKENFNILEFGFRDIFNCEINNYETFYKLLKILKTKENNFDLYYSLV